ncbi:MAG: TRAP transporter large permease subunit [Proteobacteria bacterium]|nr:TRAP transporter large permease subunit [Pseudomonadota bacterium]
MEIVFLVILIITMIAALGIGFPVAFALPGSAILTISLAALTGFLFEGNAAAFFAHGDPIQWLTAGVTNFRGIYWEPERDTLIAIPLFIFMGIMLERSKIAEDLLVTMGQLFGSIPGGVGISVVLVGALLAATTGIVGATVVAMGLISLPVMLRANYSHALATGTISASGTLGQIIPPSIVLIILADQLSNATDQAASIRKEEFKIGTGSSSMPSEFDLTSASAGDMFLGALLPGLVLVGLYIAYILILALLKPKMAPAAPHEGKYDRTFAVRVFMVLVPPLALIITVLGSIISGIATVNQAGAIGAVGAMVMASYRLLEGKPGAYRPAIMALVSLIIVLVVHSHFKVNIKGIVTGTDALGVGLAAVSTLSLMIAIAWSGWRVYKLDQTLEGVMVETAKTTSLVFIILLGAAMLTASFRAFGGEELVRDFLSGLPGGFITKFMVVMAVIFVLGFFLDFIEIAVVVVPIISPILLADPQANITAVWLGVMIGVNMQTSFLTPPFGFALFYLRGVAPAAVTTISMYKGVVPFIALQLIGLAIVGFYPPLVNYLPARVYLSSETAPPPQNPRLQACLEEYLFAEYKTKRPGLEAAISAAAGINLSVLPDKYKESMQDGFTSAKRTFDMVKRVEEADAKLNAYVVKYRPLHLEMRDIRVEIGAATREIAAIEKDIGILSAANKPKQSKIEQLKDDKEALLKKLEELKQQTPNGWTQARAKYIELEKAEQNARRLYRRTVDNAYEPLPDLIKIINAGPALAALEDRIKALDPVVATETSEKATVAIKEVEAVAVLIPGAVTIQSALAKARRAFRDEPNRADAAANLAKAMKEVAAEAAWRSSAAKAIGPALGTYNTALHDTIGLRLQERLGKAQVKEVASCLSHHRDISLSF